MENINENIRGKSKKQGEHKGSSHEVNKIIKENNENKPSQNKTNSTKLTKIIISGKSCV